MIPITEQLEREVIQFLLKEAELLDNRAYQDWLGLLTEDVRYVVPVRVTREMGTESEFAREVAHLDENYVSLEMRLLRLKNARAWAENPPSRTRHFISNIRVEESNRENEVKVKSNLLLYRTRGDDGRFDLISAERHDVLRKVDGQWKLARRVVFLDLTTLPVHNLSVIF